MPEGRDSELLTSPSLGQVQRDLTEGVGLGLCSALPDQGKMKLAVAQTRFPAKVCFLAWLSLFHVRFHLLYGLTSFFSWPGTPLSAGPANIRASLCFLGEGLCWEIL